MIRPIDKKLFGRHSVELVKRLFTSHGVLEFEENSGVKNAKDQNSDSNANTIETNKVSFSLE